MKICITGAAGNLGGLLAEYLVEETDHYLNLLIHDRDVSARLKDSERTSLFKGDLADKESLATFLDSSDVVVHFAGVLFRAGPEKFLPTTNTQYFRNLCDVAIEQRVRRIILVSFPHVEGTTTPDSPATGKLEGQPTSAHATTRLEEERHLFMNLESDDVERVCLRVGMVYGKGILMIDAARWFAKYRLLGVWKKPTWIHLISRDDFLECVKNSIVNPSVSGIYHVGDEGVQTLQEFLRTATDTWGYRRPWIMPEWLINTAAWLFELQSHLLGTRSPLTRDFIKIGKVSYYGDTSRMRRDLLPCLRYRTIDQGKVIL